MRDVTITPADAPDARAFDALMLALSSEDHLAVHLQGKFTTKGTYRWGPAPDNWRAGKYWTIHLDGEVSIDPNAIPDSYIEAQPLFVIVWHPDSVSPEIHGGAVNANHSLLADRWKAKGKSLRTGGIVQYGQGKIDGVTIRDCGALRAPGQPPEISSETFVAEIVGGGSITGCTFKDHDLGTSDDQVTVFRVMASENGEKMSDVPCLQEGNTTHAPGSRWVQAHCIYGMPGVVRHNKSVGGYAFYYGDYFKTKGVDISMNEGEDIVHGVALKLSPTPLPNADHFSHEDYNIGPNKFDSSNVNVLLDPYGPQTATRYIRNIKVDANLSLLNRGATEVMRTGVEVSKRKGCFR